MADRPDLESDSATGRPSRPRRVSGEGLARWREQQREQQKANREANRARTQAVAARLTEALPGLPLTPVSAVNGFVLGIEDAERWLDLSQKRCDEERRLVALRLAVEVRQGCDVTSGYVTRTAGAFEAYLRAGTVEW